MIARDILEGGRNDMNDGMMKPPNGCTSNRSGSGNNKHRKMNRIINSCRHLTRINSNISTLFWFLVLIALVHCNTSIPPPQKRGKDTFFSLWLSLLSPCRRCSLCCESEIIIVSLLEAKEDRRLPLIANYMKDFWNDFLCTQTKCIPWTS